MLSQQTEQHCLAFSPRRAPAPLYLLATPMPIMIKVSLCSLHLDIRVDGEVLLRALGEVVDAGILDDRGEHEEETHEQKDVESGGIGDFRNARSTGQPQRTGRQQRRYTCAQPS